MLTVDENNELPADFDEEFFREIHQKGGILTLPIVLWLILLLRFSLLVCAAGQFTGI